MAITYNYRVLNSSGSLETLGSSSTLASKITNPTSSGGSPTISDPEYSFAGWYSDENCTNKVTSSYFSGDTVVVYGYLYRPRNISIYGKSIDELSSYSDIKNQFILTTPTISAGGNRSISAIRFSNLIDKYTTEEWIYVKGPESSSSTGSITVNSSNKSIINHYYINTDDKVDTINISFEGSSTCAQTFYFHLMSNWSRYFEPISIDGNDVYPMGCLTVKRYGTTTTTECYNPITNNDLSWLVGDKTISFKYNLSKSDITSGSSVTLRSAAKVYTSVQSISVTLGKDLDNNVSSSVIEEEINTFRNLNIVSSSYRVTDDKYVEVKLDYVKVENSLLSDNLTKIPIVINVFCSRNTNACTKVTT